MTLTLNTTVFLTWSALLIAAATWMRFGQFPWEML